ncbi:hypothetical protein K0M31_002575 [Melipona bicolor]|uniref:Uncharacterized protein n=1 Tax=Melipona bicolor TaxID=60889 RepID=A0AA40GHU8_9HYME|nr:hypothetical protein K0M31_002575 [Melipona bicolor]
MTRKGTGVEKSEEAARAKLAKGKKVQCQPAHLASVVEYPPTWREPGISFLSGIGGGTGGKRAAFNPLPADISRYIIPEKPAETNYFPMSTEPGMSPSDLRNAELHHVTFLAAIRVA